VAVDDNLAEGDQIVKRGGGTLRDGQTVRVISPAG
jgi:hypothetical protein